MMKIVVIAVMSAAVCLFFSATTTTAQVLFGSYTPATTDKDKPSTYLAMNDWLDPTGQGTKQSVRVVDIGWAKPPANNKEIEDMANNWRFDAAVALAKWMPYNYADWTSPTPDAAIAGGGYDDYIDAFATNLRDTFCRPKYSNNPQARRAYIAFAPQPNGNWAPWSSSCPPCSNSGQRIKQTPQSYIKMFQHVVSKLRSPVYNLTKDVVQIVFIASAVDESDKMEEYYPGDHFVDWVGVAGDNFGSAVPGNSWTSPSALLGPMIQRLRAVAPGKPMMISSAGSGTMPNGLTAKNTWVTSLYSFALINNVKLITYYNADTTTDFAIFGGKNGASTWNSPVSNSTYNVFPAFRQAVTKKPFIGCNVSNPSYITDAEFFGQN